MWKLEAEQVWENIYRDDEKERKWKIYGPTKAPENPCSVKYLSAIKWVNISSCRLV